MMIDAFLKYLSHELAKSPATVTAYRSDLKQWSNFATANGRYELRAADDRCGRPAPVGGGPGKKRMLATDDKEEGAEPAGFFPLPDEGARDGGKPRCRTGTGTAAEASCQ